MEKIDIQELSEIVEASDEKINVIDVRPEDLYNDGHVPGAMHIPLSEIEDNLSSLDKNQHYYTMCHDGRGAEKAAEILDNNGFKVTRVIQGMPDYPGKAETA
jgi:rhodanese-related sulfurtransferase